MEVFNIKIIFKGKETTLTILPADDEYKIIYFGGIIGALKQEDDHFSFIKPEDVIPGSLPLYQYKQSEVDETEVEFRLTEELLAQIKHKVLLHLG